MSRWSIFYSDKVNYIVFNERTIKVPVTSSSSVSSWWWWWPQYGYVCVCVWRANIINETKFLLRYTHVLDVMDRIYSALVKFPPLFSRLPFEYLYNSFEFQTLSLLCQAFLQVVLLVIKSTWIINISEAASQFLHNNDDDDKDDGYFGIKAVAAGWQSIRLLLTMNS